jgi:hypothetical protein
MVSDPTLQPNPNADAGHQPSPGDILRGNAPFNPGLSQGQAPQGSQAVRTKPSTTQGRYVDIHGRDEFDHHIMSHRAELEALDTQISNLNQTIELEQQKLRETKAALESSFHMRARLLHLRAAMLHFVLELESRDARDLE